MGDMEEGRSVIRESDPKADVGRPERSDGTNRAVWQALAADEQR